MEDKTEHPQITPEERTEKLLRHIGALLGGKRCQECSGQGYRRMRWPPDETVYHIACEECGGSGFEPLPVSLAVRAERAEAEASMWRKKWAELERQRLENEALQARLEKKEGGE